MLLILGELMFEGKDQLFKSHLSSTNRIVMLIYPLQPEISFKYLLQIVFFYLPHTKLNFDRSIFKKMNNKKDHELSMTAGST